MTKQFKLIGLATLLGLMLALAGCGSEESSTSEENKQTATADDNTEEVDKEQKEVEPETSEETFYADGFKQDLLTITDNSLELSQESYDFIVDNYTLFPAKTEKDIAKAKKKADSSITSKHLNKNAQPYFGKIATFQGTVVSVEEKTLDNGEVISLTHVYDDNGQSYQVFMYKSTGDILEEDTVRFWELQLAHPALRMYLVGQQMFKTSLVLTLKK